ncbi:uncharacterized protein LOC108956381 [Eucalyptus grandis]|uniref:uncharacterized protein LOC108956381 n=1 Tax=Eucalyptus grandis TaxID=71139 RepID=UPI00192E9EED|nr:uncharacterized protein LOC108956381 [Eucalyptus grandis]
MLDLTTELVAQAASNSLVIFCFCNLLIVIILMAPKPSSNSKEGSEFHLPILTHVSEIDEKRIDIEQPPKHEETSPQVMELCISENLEMEGRSYNNECEDDHEDDGECNNDDDDELRRRIEAFIDKVNREWKAEKLRTHYLCEQVDL